MRGDSAFFWWDATFLVCQVLLWRITKGSGPQGSLSAWERHQLSNGTCLRQLREAGVLVAPSAAHTHLGHREILVGIFEVSESVDNKTP